MSPMWFRYQYLDFEVVKIEVNHSHHPKQPHMSREEKRYVIVGDHIIIFPQESLTCQKNNMIDIFSQILSEMSTTTEQSSSNYFGGANQFKVEVNFCIPLFEGMISVDAMINYWVFYRDIFLSTNYPIQEKLYSRLCRI